MTDFAVTKIPDPVWGSPRIARAIGRNGDPWGVLAVLRGTPWEGLFPLVSIRTFDQALRGHATPLMQVLGPPPHALAKRLSDSYRACRMRSGCINAAPTCVPGKKMPECWEPDQIESIAVEVASKVARFWKENVPVIVVVPEE